MGRWFAEALSIADRTQDMAQRPRQAVATKSTEAIQSVKNPRVRPTRGHPAATTAAYRAKKTEVGCENLEVRPEKDHRNILTAWRAFCAMFCVSIRLATQDTKDL
jgi:hypothetical protein